MYTFIRRFLIFVCRTVDHLNLSSHRLRRDGICLLYCSIILSPSCFEPVSLSTLFWIVCFSQSSLTQPQMMVVADLDDIFVPLPDDLLVNLSDSRNVVDAFLDSLHTMFQENVNVESALGPALRAAFMVMVCWSTK